jgi:hypothetical protein
MDPGVVQVVDIESVVEYRGDMVAGLVVVGIG